MIDKIVYCNSCKKWVNDYSRITNVLSCNNCGDIVESNKEFYGVECIVCHEWKPESTSKKTNITKHSDTEVDYDFICEDCTEAADQRRDDEKSYRQSYL